MMIDNRPNLAAARELMRAHDERRQKERHEATNRLRAEMQRNGLLPVTILIEGHLGDWAEGKARDQIAANWRAPHFRVQFRDCPGGDIRAAFGILNDLREMEVAFDTHAEGLCASAAIPIYCAGRFRTADARTRFMIHQGAASLKGANLGHIRAGGLRRIADDIDRFDSAIMAILKARTSITAQQLARAVEGDLWLDAQQAAAVGLCHTLTGVRCAGHGFSARSRREPPTAAMAAFQRAFEAVC